jgi:hypothetical protein
MIFGMRNKEIMVHSNTGFPFPKLTKKKKNKGEDIFFGFNVALSSFKHLYLFRPPFQGFAARVQYHVTS